DGEVRFDWGAGVLLADLVSGGEADGLAVAPRARGQGGRGLGEPIAVLLPVERDRDAPVVAEEVEVAVRRADVDLELAGDVRRLQRTAGTQAMERPQEPAEGRPSGHPPRP